MAVDGFGTDPGMHYVCGRCGRVYRHSGFVSLKVGPCIQHQMTTEDTVSDLRPFDPAGNCPKCGHDDISTRYISASGREHGLLPRCGYRLAGSPEHMDRHCRRCSYEWAEVPLSEDGR